MHLNGHIFPKRGQIPHDSSIHLHGGKKMVQLVKSTHSNKEHNNNDHAF